MKKIFLLLALATLAQANVHDRTIDDLGRIPLMIKKNEIMKQVHYPNYRIGGGSPPRGNINDCLILDLPTSDTQVTLTSKLELAQKIKVYQGFSGIEDSDELIPVIKDNKVVYLLLPDNLYMTRLFVKAEDKLITTVQAYLPEREQQTPASLIYVRGCRL